MKTTRLVLKNFGCWKAADLGFDRPIILIVAENGMGKTTLATALELAKTGRVARFEGRRLSLATLIGPAGENAEVLETVEADGKTWEIGRVISSRGMTASINGKPTTKDVTDFFSPVAMRDPARAWRAVASVYGVIDADDAGQKALLLDLVDAAVPEALLAGLSFEVLSQGAGRPKTIDAIADFYQKAYDARRVAKARRDAVRVPPAPTVPEQDLAAIERRLGELREEERRHVAADSQAAGERAALVGERDTLAEHIDKATIRLAELGDRDAAVKRLEAARNALEEGAGARQAHDVEVRAIETLEANLRGLREQAKALGSLGKACVISGEIECPLKPAQRKKQDETWQARIDGLKSSIEGRRAALKKPEDDAKARNSLKETEALVAAIDDIGRQLEPAKERLARLKARIAEIPEVAEDAEAATLRTRIARGEANLLEAQRINSAWETSRRAEAELSELGAQVEALEALCRALGPKGIGEKLLGERVGAVVERLNAVLGGFKLSVSVSTDPWMLRVNGRPAVLMSASERFRVGVAFAVAVSSFTGAKWCCIDGVDILDRANRTALFGILSQAVADGHIDQAIVTATTQQAASLRSTDRLRVYSLASPGVARAVEEARP